MYISTHISYENYSAEIRFPIDDDSLDIILRTNKMPTDTTLPFLVEDVHYPTGLSCLNCEQVNLDELNYLAKLMDCFCEDEIEEFYVAMDQTGTKSLKDLINLTFNLDKFTIIKNVGDMVKVGRDYTLNTEGAVPVDPSLDDHFAEIGRKLLGSGKGVFTEHGLLFIEDMPLKEVYDGQVFPTLGYQPSIVALDLEYNGKGETVFLPDSDLAVQKAIRRLGVSWIDDCISECEVESPDFKFFSDRFTEILESEGISALNALLREIKAHEDDITKLAAVLEVTDITLSAKMIALMNHLDKFILIENVEAENYSEIGMHFIDHNAEYDLHPDLYEYFDFNEFGEHMAEELSGQFTSLGFIYYNGEESMEDVLNETNGENSSMTMGGM